MVSLMKQSLAMHDGHSLFDHEKRQSCVYVHDGVAGLRQDSRLLRWQRVELCGDSVRANLGGGI